MQEAEYREILAECLEFGWLNRYQEQDWRQFEADGFLARLEELDFDHQVLAALFLQEKFLEPGVGLAACGQPRPRQKEGLVSSPRLQQELEQLPNVSHASLLAVLSSAESVRKNSADAIQTFLEDQGFIVLRAVGRVREDALKDRLLERLVQQGLDCLPPDKRRDLLVFQAQHLQLMAARALFPVRPGGVYNVDPGMNSLKLFQALAQLLLELLRVQPVVVVVEEAQLAPALLREALSHLCWLIRNARSGLAALDPEVEHLDQPGLALILTLQPPVSPPELEWLDTLKKRKVRVVDLDSPDPAR